MIKPELLAPAGDWERLEAALRFGADAVYLGGPGLQLRAAPTAFSIEQIARAAARCHSLGKKLYVTVNAYAREADLEMLPAYGDALYQAGADAALVSDPGVLRLLQQGAPQLPLHLSTQANCTNRSAALFWYQQGVRRIVLARELSLEEIRALRAGTPPDLELEVFVHGALCVSYSGRCLLSSVLTGRDANRGGCAQPCRWQYRLEEAQHPGEYLPIEQDQAGTYLLSSWDLNLLPYLSQLEEAGVSSFKIEGRMKSPYYVATVTGAYRRAMDGSAPTDALLAELDTVSHRPYSSGFLFTAQGAPTGADGYRQSCRFVAAVRWISGGRCVAEVRERFFAGDRLELVSPHAFGESFVVRDLRDHQGLPLTAAVQAGRLVSFTAEGSVAPGDFLRLRIS